APVAFFVPSRVPVVAKDELRANAGCFASRARGLHVAQIAQEIDQPGEALGHGAILSAAAFEFQYIEDLATRRQQPAERVGKREGDALPCALIQLAAIAVRGV